ncbi:MAG TPA: phosphatidate cytidylyltransferase [Anaerolineales bacterium]|nr:phosphatidate cytidylyltransferase [Anaerolineales bacterium]
MFPNLLAYQNPLTHPLFLPILQTVGGLFIFGFGLVLFFARKNLRAGLKGELGLRYLGWLILAPLFLALTFVGGAVAAIILLIFCGRIVYEYIRAVEVERPYAIYMYVLIPITLAVAAFLPDLYFALPAASILLLTLIPIFTHRVENLYQQLSFAGRGYLYLVWTVGHIILLQKLGGPGLVITAAIGVALSDVMQYTVGKLIGKHIIAPEVNPRKAWEGLIGDLLGAGAAVALLRFALPAQFNAWHLVALAFIIGLGAAWGDLISSLVKRVAGVKDWGKIIPGHGGLLDRANSMVIVFPLVYYFAYLVLE